MPLQPVSYLLPLALTALVGGVLAVYAFRRRVQTEADLARTQQDFYSVIEEMQDSYFEADLSGRFLYVNRALAHYTGYERDQLIGQSYRRIFPREYIRTVFEVFAQVIATGEPLEKMDFEWITRERNRRYGELSVSAMRNAEGEVIGTRGIVHDVTDLVRAEQAIREERDVAERELEIGRQIQAGFFPRGLPSPPGWEVAASFQAAHQVAGDFYDAFEVGNGDHLALVIADVCDKGVGAALFMALFRSLIRAFSEESVALEPGGPVDRLQIERSLRGIVSRTNDYIAGTHGRSNMFATLFLGLLEPASGALHYVNAGHDAPILSGRNGIEARLMPTGPAVGMLPGLEFQTALRVLAPGDLLLAFTDGVIDARGQQDTAFGEDTLLAHLNQPPPSAAGLTAQISDSLSVHIGHTDQFDDITLLAVRHGLTSERPPVELELSAQLESLAAVRQFIERTGAEMGLEREMIQAFKLSADEACANVVQHAYAGRTGAKMNLTFERQQDKVRLTVSDRGRAFQLDEVDSPDLWAPWQDRPQGGLGLYLIRENMDELSYDADERTGNRLTMGRFLPGD